MLYPTCCTKIELLTIAPSMSHRLIRPIHFEGDYVGLCVIPICCWKSLNRRESATSFPDIRGGIEEPGSVRYFKGFCILCPLDWGPRSIMLWRSPVTRWKWRAYPAGLVITAEDSESLTCIRSRLSGLDMPLLAHVCSIRSWATSILG